MPSTGGTHIRRDVCIEEVNERSSGAHQSTCCARKTKDTPPTARPDEAGEALVEFLAVMILFVIPLFYIILSLGQVQAATYAAESAARNAARILSAEPQAHVLAERQVELTFADFGLPAPQIHAACQPTHCPSDGIVTVVVSAQTPLPLVPDWVGAQATLPVSAQVSMPVEGLSINADR